MLSTRSQYGLRLIIALARRGNDSKPIPLSQISKEEGISTRYLQKISQTLVINGYIKPVRGLRGGFVLTKVPSEINLYELVKVLEGEILSPTCIEEKISCPKTSSCLAKKMWVEASDELKKGWSQLTIKNLLEKGEDISGKKNLF